MENDTPDPIFSKKRLRRFINEVTPARSNKLEWFPIISVLRGYSVKKARDDAKAGMNVALLDFPQGMAYAVIAGLPFFMGIYASAVAAFLGPLMASSRYIMLGPTNAIAVLTLSSFLTLDLTQEQVVAALPLLMLMIGVIMLAGAYFRVAGIIRYVSRTVITGYISAAALLIIVKQLKNVLGVETPRTATFFDSLVAIIKHVPETHLPSLYVGLATVALYLIIRKVLRGVPHVAVVLVSMYFVVRIWGQQWGLAPLSPTPLDGGAWPVTMPQFSFSLFGQLAGPAAAIAFLSLLESSSIAKTLAARSGDTVELNQQMLSMGTANIGCAFLSGMPISGSLTRSQLNYSSGARTPMSSIFSACLLTLGILLLAPYMSDIPMPALSAMVIMVGVSLLNPANIRVALGTTGSDAAVFVTTFVSGLLFPLDNAIAFGVLVSVFLFMRKAGAPRMVEYGFSKSGRELQPVSERPAIALLHVDGNLFFGSSDIFLDQARNLTNDDNLRAVIIRLRNAHNIDATCALAMRELVNFAHSKGRYVIFSGVHPEVSDIFRNSGLTSIMAKNTIFLEDPDNPTLSTSQALKRARELVGTSMDVRLFVREQESSEGAAQEPAGDKKE